MPKYPLKMKKKQTKPKSFKEDIVDSTEALRNIGINKLYAYYILYIDKIEKKLNKVLTTQQREYLFEEIRKQTNIKDIIEIVCKLSEEW